MNQPVPRIILALMLAAASMNAVSEPLSARAQQLFDRATQAAKLSANAEVIPTKDGRSFFAVWEPQNIKGKPHKWIVSLHGSNGFATRDLEIWGRYLQDRNIGAINLQWWMGSGDKTEDYYSPGDAYREIDVLLRRMGIKPGEAMLHGFSRGSANIYAVAALDRSRGRRYFSVIVANAGGASLGYPPTQAVDAGRFGEMPYKGSRWVTVCGDRDQNPDRDGCPAMRRTTEWLKKQGGELAFAIEDRDGGHGALHLNPQNATRLLDWFQQN